ncbi:MAG: hypothetical protein ISS78_07815 [Phycisphaerae bacterium]|nr:hypothetical protein [Phycisphaerae bacterium]
MPTVQFQERMKPAALRIYRRLFPGCEVEDLRKEGVKVHVLDKEFGIDSLLTTKQGQWFSIQEKYRAHKWLQYLDFTQEYMNAEGTEHESPGEWFKLGAQLYFYGWANEAETDFEKWAVLDVAAYKLLVERAGGLAAIGTKRQNRIHGRASFFAIPIQKLRPAFVYTYHDLEKA